MNVLVLWLNNNEIICDVGLGCENENIDQGRSYDDKNLLKKQLEIKDIFINVRPSLIYIFVFTTQINIANNLIIIQPQ